MSFSNFANWKRSDQIAGMTTPIGIRSESIFWFSASPRRLQPEKIDEICWNAFRTHSVAGALEENVVIMEGRLRAGAPIAVYGDFER
jgi:hypothetical protein